MRLMQLTFLIGILANTSCHQENSPLPPDPDTDGNRPPPVSCGEIVEWKYMEDGISKSALMVQREALIVDESGQYILKLVEIDDKQFVVEIPVKAGGQIAGNWVQIIPMLKNGDQVVVRANERIASRPEVEVIQVIGEHPPNTSNK